MNKLSLAAIIALIALITSTIFVPLCACINQENETIEVSRDVLMQKAIQIAE